MSISTKWMKDGGVKANGTSRHSLMKYFVHCGAVQLFCTVKYLQLKIKVARWNNLVKFGYVSDSVFNLHALQNLTSFEHFYYKKAAVVSNFGKIHHNFLFLVPRMIELGRQTFMPIQTSDLHRVTFFWTVLLSFWVTESQLSPCFSVMNSVLFLTKAWLSVLGRNFPVLLYVENYTPYSNQGG